MIPHAQNAWHYTYTRSVKFAYGGLIVTYEWRW